MTVTDTHDDQTNPRAMLRRQRGRDRMILGSVLVLAAALRFWGIGWGLPDRPSLHPDEVQHVIKHALGISAEHLEVGFLNYPNFIHYSIAFVHGALGRLGFETGQAAATRIGRTIMACYGTLTCVLVWGLALGLGANRRGAALAALYTALLPLHVWESHIAVTDVMMTFWIVAALVGAIRLLRPAAWYHAALTGVALGLAVGSKYTAALTAAPVVLAILLSRGGWRQVMVTALIVGLCAIAACFLVTPFSFIRFDELLQAMQFESHHVRTGHIGFSVPAHGWQYRRYVYQWFAAWPFSFGIVLYASALAGIGALCCRMTASRAVVGLFIILFFGLTGSWSFTPLRYSMPIVVIGAVAAGIWHGALLERRGMVRRVTTAIIGITVIYTGCFAVSTNARYSRDTRIEAADWLATYSDLGVMHYAMGYSPYMAWPLVSSRVNTKFRREGHLQHYILRDDADLLQVSSMHYDRWPRQDNERFIEMYDRLRAPGGNYALVKRFERGFLNRSFYRRLDPMFAAYFVSPTLEFYERRAPESGMPVRDPSTLPMTDIMAWGISNQGMLVGSDADWEYWHSEEEPPEDSRNHAWWSRSYQSDAWTESGPGPVGYGYDDLATELTASSKKITACFRHEFWLRNPRDYEALAFRMRMDDGARVFLNGHEVVRVNVPRGDIDMRTPATHQVKGQEETTFTTVLCDPGYLVEGLNTVAADVHQTQAKGSDFRFELQLVGILPHPDSILRPDAGWKVPPKPVSMSQFKDRGWLDPGFGGKRWRDLRGGSAEPAPPPDAQSDDKKDGDDQDDDDWRRLGMFRRVVEVDKVEEDELVEVMLLTDVPARLFLNGVEVTRAGILDGEILDKLDQDYSRRWRRGGVIGRAIVPSRLLQAGHNVLAVQALAGAGSSDFGGLHVELLPYDRPMLAEYAWTGAVTPTSAVVSVRCGVEDDATRLLVRDGAGGAVATVSPTSPVSLSKGNRLARFEIAGLSPSSRYHYALDVGGRHVSSPLGEFETFPGDASSFTFAVGSCAMSGSSHPVFGTVRQAKPLFYLMLGDFFYSEHWMDREANLRRYYSQALRAGMQRELYQSVPIAYVWDDHDYGKDDAHSDSDSRTAARLAYQNVVPHYPLAAGTGDVPIYQSFAVGRTYFILTDLRSERTPSVEPDHAGKTMMGERQKAWFKSQLLYAHERYSVIFWGSSVPWIATPEVNSDTWGGYHHERVELANFIRDHEISELVILGGDTHMIAFDDGSNSDYAEGGGAPVPVFQAGALDRVGTEKGGPYSHGAFPNRTLGEKRDGQFGLVSVEDGGGSEIRVTFSGKRYECDSGQVVELLRSSLVRSASGAPGT
ncbi:MAG: alkaline phosphatase D family protein [Verrucomicrobia bacterium]|nr:alkaline phosphatase D family protein [Verrucomicrobiota bacterium]MDA1085700.1 alkaline phosphatase D family protein [Verrucomicrobiota bacterium]